MPLFHRNVSEPVLTANPISPLPHQDTSFSYSHGISQNGSINSGSSLDESPSPVFNQAEHLSKQELEKTISAHQQLIDAAALYREQSIQMAAAAAGLGTALEQVAKEKAATESGQGLQAAAGLQFLVSNHHLLLANLISKAFEEPLTDNLHRHKASIQQSQQNYETVVKAMNNKIGETEVHSLKNANRKKRDLRQFRRVLQDLTQQIDELERVKIDYSRYVFETERRNHQFILSKVSGLVRGQVDIYDRISSKGLGEPTLEQASKHSAGQPFTFETVKLIYSLVSLQMVTSNPDPFCAYQTSDESKAIFSVLPPISLIDATASSTIQSPMDFPDSMSIIRDSPPTLPRKNEEISSSLSSTPSQSTELIPPISDLTSQPLLNESTNPIHSHIHVNDSANSSISDLNAAFNDETNIVCFRTDYSDEAQWEALTQCIDQDDHQISSFLDMQSTPALEGKSIRELCETRPSKYFLVCDSQTMVDQAFTLVQSDTKREIRFRVHELWIILRKLSKLDEHFEEFGQRIDVGGVYNP